MKATESTYKNKQSIVLENHLLRVEFLPDPGGKMVSFFSKDTGYEFLVQRPNEIYRDQPFDGEYVAGECSGFDDMFPTIDECKYANAPWEGIKMADHGEVWSLPWDYYVQDHMLKMAVTGVRFPYRLEKNAFFINEHTLRLNYRLLNRSAFDFEFLWAGHLMLNMEPGTQVKVPPECRKVVTMLTNSGKKYGEIADWPNFIDKNGEIYRADISRDPSVGGFEKYYFQQALKSGWCEMHLPNGNQLKVSFPAESVPYLGILMNEKGWDDLYNLFIEPCTVCYDRPDIAKQHGQSSMVTAFGEYAWHLDLSL